MLTNIDSVAVIERQRIKNSEGKWELKSDMRVALPSGMSASDPELEALIAKNKEAIKVTIYSIERLAGRSDQVAEIKVEKFE